MDTLREAKTIPGMSVTCYKQSGAHIMCKIVLSPSDAIELCKRTKSGLFKNKEFHEMFINMLVIKLDEQNAQEKALIKQVADDMIHDITNRTLY